MPVINVLQPHVADMIAAGEVVERPASVIKELVENSLDAGAKNITVEIRGGGATYIRVTDDGCGMAPEDAGIAFLRHATSKLHDEKGLEAISTMGFRGEALAAISSVSKIELNTRRRGDASGTRVVLEAGDIQEMFAAGCPDGTTMTVRDLFYNTPARLKFLKSDRSEASACQLAALRCALGHPEVSIRFIKDRNEEFFTPGDGKQESCVYSLMGRDMATQMLRCTGENNGIRVTGFVSSPAYGKGNRSAQFFFCNGRFIKSQLLQAAVEQAQRELGGLQVLVCNAGIAQVKLIDATPIGINVRSTVATYANVHDELRKIYARSPLAREKGYKAGDFSYNTGRLRCPGCDGTGEVSLDVQFLPDVNIVCPDCRGSRYAWAAYGVKLTNEAEQAVSLPELMEMDVNSALAFCGGMKTVSQRLQTLQQLGLGYLTLGEETPSLSGGEAQRLKLASEIGKTQEDSVFVFDEPSIGLHPLDVQVLLGVFQALLDNGATVVVIEHDLDVIRNADYLVDMGPGGGDAGGRIVAAGTPEQVRQNPESITGRYI